MHQDLSGPKSVRYFSWYSDFLQFKDVFEFYKIHDNLTSMFAKSVRDPTRLTNDVTIMTIALVIDIVTKSRKMPYTVKVICFL